MATLEQFGLLCQVTDQTYRLVRNMRANASGYITLANAINSGTADPSWTAAKLAEVMKADAGQFLLRLATLTGIGQRNVAALQAALGIIGETLANAVALRDSLVAVANHVVAANLVSTADCVAEANNILSGSPSYDGLF